MEASTATSALNRKMAPAPVFRFGYVNRILAEVDARGPIQLQALFDEVDPESLFKSEKEHKAPLARARALIRYARALGLLEGSGDELWVTDAGREYVAAGAVDEPFEMTAQQATLLRDQIVSLAAKGGVAWGAVLAASLVRSETSAFSGEDLGRALSVLGGMSQWREAPTYQAQGDRFLGLLQDARMVDGGELTDEGRTLVAAAGVPNHKPLSQLAAEAGPIKAPSDLASDATVWIIRAGRHGRYEDLAREQGVCLIGWSEIGEISSADTRDTLKQRIAEMTEETRPASLASQAGQISRFVHDVSEGDLVVLPLLSHDRHVAIGRVVGPYEHRTDGPFADTDAQNTRPVTWLEPDLPYDRFDSDLQDAFGQQGTVSVISKPNAAQRIINVLGGEDKSAIHLVLKWSAAKHPDTIERHLEIAEAEGAVWWGRLSKPNATGLGQATLAKLEEQLVAGSETHVFLHGSGATWRTRLLAITTEQDDVKPELIPPYYDPVDHHSLWVKLTDFEQIEPEELIEGYVLAQSGDPVTAGGLGNQGPLIIRQRSSTLPGQYFILSKAQSDDQYDDREGQQYHWTSRSSGAPRQLSNSRGAHVVFYRSGEADDGTSRSYYAVGRLGSIETAERDDGLTHFIATIEQFQPFANPVPFADGPSRNPQRSIQQITHAQFQKLLMAGGEMEPGELRLEDVRSLAVERGLDLPEDLYAQLVAALTSSKHVILTGPPGTAKTTLAQIVAEVGQQAGLSNGYVLTTATADWTTYDTIGGLRPTGPNTLDFEEGQFLKAIRHKQWLVIDELNRAQFDRAFGQLFTVLSGQPVVLPYHRPTAGPDEPLTLVPEGAVSPIEGADDLPIPLEWRVIATMNVFDKSLLFEMSYALMRRFAFVEVPSPSRAVFTALINREVSGDEPAGELAMQLLQLRDLKDLGPAVYLDLARFLKQRIAIGGADQGQLLYEAFYSYLLPQFEGVDVANGERLFKNLKPLMGSPDRRERLRRTLNAVLGLELQPPASNDGAADEIVPTDTSDAIDDAESEVGEI